MKAICTSYTPPSTSSPTTNFVEGDLYEVNLVDDCALVTDANQRTHKAKVQSNGTLHIIFFSHAGVNESVYFKLQE
jgi:hypothetical protein